MNRPAASTKLPRAQSRPGPNDCSFASSKKRRARELPRKAIRGILRYLQKRNQEQHQHQAAAWRRHVALERFAAVGGTLLVFLGRERAEISCFQAPRAVFFFVQRAVKGESIVVSPGPGPFALPSSGVLVPTRETYGKIEWKNPYCILHPHTVSGTPRALGREKGRREKQVLGGAANSRRSFPRPSAAPRSFAATPSPLFCFNFAIS